MGRLALIVLVSLISSLALIGQEESNKLIGTITYTTSDNYYVRFESTEDLNPGDTLFFQSNQNAIPVLVIKKKSSRSAVCYLVGTQELSQGDKVLAYSIQAVESEPKDVLAEEKTFSDSESESILPISEENPTKESKRIQNIDSRFSVASYSNLEEEQNFQRHRLVGRVRISARQISNSRWSIFSYVNYDKNMIQRNDFQSDEDRVLVYNMALKYEVDSSWNIIVGRYINRKASSLGAFDGIQFEKSIGTFYTGALAGYKPDLTDFKLNTDLFEYGAYIGHSTKKESYQSETTLGFLEQQFLSETDRRYLYFQHRSTLARNTSLFGSAELDIYGINGSDLRLTNFYITARHRFNRRLNISASYDNRRRIIYYETYRTEVERLLADDEARQGVRLRISARPFKHLLSSVSYSKRFQTGTDDHSDNYNAYLSLTKVPLIEGRLSVRLNRNSSLNGTSHIFNVNYSRNILRWLYSQVYFRKVNYLYHNGRNQSYDYLGAQMYFRVTKTIKFSLYYELGMDEGTLSHRLNTKLTKRLNIK